MAARLSQVSNHLSTSFGRGLLAGEVAIITGQLVQSLHDSCPLLMDHIPNIPRTGNISFSQVLARSAATFDCLVLGPRLTVLSIRVSVEVPRYFLRKRELRSSSASQYIPLSSSSSLSEHHLIPLVSMKRN